MKTKDVVVVFLICAWPAPRPKLFRIAFLGKDCYTPDVVYSGVEKRSPAQSVAAKIARGFSYRIGSEIKKDFALEFEVNYS